MSATPKDLLREAETRLDRLADEAEKGALDPAIALMVDAIRAGGVIQAFGTGHSEAFAMEIAGRAGGLIPTNKFALRDIVLHGDRGVDVLTAELEREPWVVDELMAVSPVSPEDVFIIASNSGVNGSIVGVALWAKEHGHKAPYGDSTLQLTETISAGAISSITAAFIAQLLTLGVARTIADAGEVPPMYISANIPGGDVHNHALEERYLSRLRRGA